jgi:hypothetical protein
MLQSNIIDKIDLLVDDLLNDGSMSSSSLASMLMAARDSVREGYHVALARRVWDANNELKGRPRNKKMYRLDVPASTD